MLNLITVNCVNYLSNYANIRNKSVVFDEPLSTIRLHTDMTIFVSLFWAALKIFYKCDIWSRFHCNYNGQSKSELSIS